MSPGFSPESESEGARVLEEYARELSAECLRIARRNEAEVVSAAYVRSAAQWLRLRRSSPWADVMMSIGTTLAGLGGGTGTTLATMDGDRPAWLTVSAIAAGGVGLLLTGAGLASKRAH